MQETFNKLTELIKKHNKILIMTHKNPDFDGMGSAIALQQIIHSFNKESYICKNQKEINISLSKAYNYILKKDLYYKTISKSETIDLFDEDTLLIILDTHKKEMLEVPSIVDKTANIVVLDHHIKSKYYIKDCLLSYINSSLSSTVEIIVNYLKYLNKTVDPLIATILLVGLEIDTNNFKLKTTDKTYETAASLAKMGADNILKQELVQENKEDYLKRQKIIENSFMLNEEMILCIADNKIYESKDLARIASELLHFENVSASFVIGNIKENTVGISARSIGNIDVEKIMFKLGGGGHMTEAATQIKDITLNEAMEKLKNAIGG